MNCNISVDNTKVSFNVSNITNVLCTRFSTFFRKPNILDNMISIMEKYASNLEALVEERTDQLREEKKKTEDILLQMLPR